MIGPALVPLIRKEGEAHSPSSGGSARKSKTQWKGRLRKPYTKDQVDCQHLELQKVRVSQGFVEVKFQSRNGF